MDLEKEQKEKKEQEENKEQEQMEQKREKWKKKGHRFQNLGVYSNQQSRDWSWE